MKYAGKILYFFRRYKKLALLILSLATYLIVTTYEYPDIEYSTVLYDAKGKLIAAHIAADQQWRFKQTDTLPYKYKVCLLQYEDKNFYYHPGVDPIAIVRAAYQNLKNGRIVSGGSTITMQLVRILTGNKRRTMLRKIYEILLATRMELRYDKEEILKKYASNAPYGGNIVGLGAASWWYFGTLPNDMSWAQAAMLAVLPNSPGLIRPGKNNDILKAKRDRLLKKLLHKKIIDTATYELAIEEPIPIKRRKFPQITPHLQERIRKKNPAGGIFHTYIDADLQKQINNIIARYYLKNKANNINNYAVLVLNIKTGNVLAYAANNLKLPDGTGGKDVDIIQAPRSTGSVLKPFLYAAMLTDGLIMPHSLVADIPVNYTGYMPQNYTRQYAGAIRADKALARSLNVPAVNMLADFGIAKFLYILQNTGFSHTDKPASHYGLSLILGGSEASLEEITRAYAAMANFLINYNTNKKYKQKFSLKLYEQGDEEEAIDVSNLFSPASVYFTLQALINVERPDNESNWIMFSSSQKIAWKTGTSFGFRDAWAVGVTPEYAVGVWAGNADGSDSPKLIGVLAAAPLMFEIFKLLPKSKKWFSMPNDDVCAISVCDNSGYKASQICPSHTELVPKSCLKSKICPYHILIHLDSSQTYRVNSDCYDIKFMKHKAWFVLPPTMQWYYMQANAEYKPLPPFMPGCDKKTSRKNTFEFIYPKNNSIIKIPVALSGKRNQLIVRIASLKYKTKIFWHLDGKYIGFTITEHQMPISPLPGKHIITIMDTEGNKASVRFTVE